MNYRKEKISTAFWLVGTVILLTFDTYLTKKLGVWSIPFINLILYFWGYNTISHLITNSYKKDNYKPYRNRFVFSLFAIINWAISLSFKGEVSNAIAKVLFSFSSNSVKIFTFVIYALLLMLFEVISGKVYYFITRIIRAIIIRNKK